MEHRISEDELTVLAYLHENAKGYGPRHTFDAREVGRALNMGDAELVVATSYLEGWGITGHAGGVTSTNRMGHIYLTSQGEAYMREVDEKAAEAGLLNRGKRLGVAGLKGAGQAAVKIGTAVLTELAKSMVKPG